MLQLIWLTAACSGDSAPAEPEQDTAAEEEPAAHSQEDASFADSSYLSCTGEIAVHADAHISLHAPIQGIVKKINVIEGQKVRQGEVLAVLQHMDIIRLQESYLKSKSEFRLNEQEFNRKQDLYKKGVIPDKEFEQAQSAYSVAKASYESLKKQLQLLGISTQQLEEGQISDAVRITSPVNGVVTAVRTNLGGYAGQDVPLFELIDEKDKHLHLMVFASEIGRIREGQHVIFRIAGNPKEYKGTVVLIGRSVDPATKAVGVHVEMDGEARSLVVGSPAMARIQLK